MRYIDVFGGIGGFRHGIDRATKGEWKCVGYYDNDKYAVQTYNKNFGEQHKPSDIREVKEFPDIDLICGGFPCQSFSIAGSRRGFEDTRGTLFFEIMRIAKLKRPKYLFLENVKGILNHEEGKTTRIILQSMDELGYDCQWMVLNSKLFGVPQNRERVFFIASLRGTPRPEILPFREDHKKIKGDKQSEVVGTLCAQYGKQPTDGSYIKQYKYKQERKFDISPTLTSTEAKDTLVSSPRAIMSPGMINKKQNGRRQKEVDEPMFTLTEHDIHGVDNGGLRRLTPIECERLQGFPDNWTEGVSDTQRYKQLGNAVTVNVIEAIVRRWNNETINTTNR